MKQVQAAFTFFLKYFFWFVVVANAILIFHKSLSYYPANFSRGFLSDKQQLFQHTVYPIFFYGHISISSIILLIGLFQFSNKLRAKYTHTHRLLGKLYVVLVLFISAPSAFVMGVYAVGHWLIKIGFVIASVLWWWYTYKAYVEIRKKKIAPHKAYMQRSYIISLLAVFLRVYYYIIVALLQVESNYTYLFVVYASWLPNIVVFEIWHRYKVKKTAKRGLKQKRFFAN